MLPRAPTMALLLLSALAITSTSALTAVSKSDSASAAAELGLSDAEKNRPVTKVITLLKDMLKQLEKEGTEDEEIYNKMACWCETNDKEKTASIGEAESHIQDLQTKIEELTALSAQLTVEIKNHKQEVTKNQGALDKATALRRKQLAEFNAEEKDMLGSISALKSAVTVLSKHQGGSSLLQLSHSRSSTVASTLRNAMDKYEGLLKGALTPSQRRTAMSFIQAQAKDVDYFDSEPTFKQSYAPQSGEIFGILSQMKETFEKNLKSSQKEEMANQKAYEELKAAKQEEITSGQDQVDSKTQQLADTDEKNAQSKEDMKDTKESLGKDQEFLAMLKDKCSMTDGEWEARQKTRQQEMEAVSKALAVLSGDDAHDLFTKTFNPSFVQTKATTSSSREQASKVLVAAADRVGNPRLSVLATRVRLDAFTEVKKAINDMVAQLGKEKQEEIKHKDFCIDEFNTNQQQTNKKEREKKDLTGQVEDLELTIKTLGDALDTLKKSVAEMQVQLKHGGEDRELENKEFQTTVSDQRATQKILKASLIVLQDFYGKESLLQGDSQAPAGPAPPAGFEKYEKNEQSGGVMRLIESIIRDAKAMEQDAIRSEEDAQKAYEDFVKETNNSIETKGKEIINKSEEKAKKEEELVEAQKSLDAAGLESEQLANYKTELHSSCDFVLKNFDMRQTARDEEVEALKQALSILSGAKFD